jgi:hypothetical protein
MILMAEIIWQKKRKIMATRAKLKTLENYSTIIGSINI